MLAVPCLGCMEKSLLIHPLLNRLVLMAVKSFLSAGNTTFSLWLRFCFSACCITELQFMGLKTIFSVILNNSSTSSSTSGGSIVFKSTMSFQATIVSNCEKWNSMSSSFNAHLLCHIAEGLLFWLPWYDSIVIIP